MKIKKDPFLKFLYQSLFFHLLILVVLTVKILFFPNNVLDYNQAMRVDIVALPDKVSQLPTPKAEPQKPKVTQEQPKPVKKVPEAQKPKINTKKPKQIILDNKKTKKTEKIKEEEVEEEQDSAIARLKALQKIKNEEALPAQEFKGNVLSKGNSLTGLAKLHHDSYLDELDSHIRSFWNLPEWLADGNLKASVLLLINKDGGIIGKSFIMKSGNDLFDQHVLGTLEKANPLPPPPPSLIDFYSNKGVEIRFPE